MSRKNSYDGFDELDEWEGAIRVRPRWHEHEPVRRHPGGNKEGKRVEKTKHRRRHASNHGEGED